MDLAIGDISDCNPEGWIETLSVRNCNPAVVCGKGELQILGFGDESQQIVR